MEKLRKTFEDGVLVKTETLTVPDPPTKKERLAARKQEDEIFAALIKADPGLEKKIIDNME